MTDQDYILIFKKRYDNTLYESIEQSSDIFNKRVQLKNSSLTGTVINLWLPANIVYYRKNNLWLVSWDNGNNGIIEDKDVIILK